ncbi:mycophenolic acid synthesis protein B-like [Selaginella moellendorffii]|uniref:mycophenolic acid synthesis protein B-like n=1 Tax=Selaginella moellendorffii TaxID=88036 RepID=UPI000D1CA09A|nr:mycophenolic acid synthesis protein B-like [Selaginella moellendorffii]|eukprot:XP_024536846.1 mycophenolic acid synthesis protein B-like [Selaginella moellendorffii]
MVELGSLLWCVALLGLVVYKGICIHLRRQRAEFIASLDPVRDAHKIVWYLYAVEFPFLSQKALEFGTIQTLGIPSITKLLYKTKYGLKDPQKRAAETNILVSEFLHHHVDSDRGSYALRRLNGIHAQFKIPNHEFVYVLCLNVVKPMDFCREFGFRAWTPREELASYTLWHDIGLRMGLKDIPENIQAMRDYIDEFEEKYAKFDEKNKSIVQELKHLVLDSFPRRVQPVVETGICALIGERIRIATGLPKPRAIVEWAVLSALKLLSGTMVSIFMPPRTVAGAKGSIDVDWSPNPEARPEELRPLNVNVYRPPSFEKGYKLAELGALKPGKIGPRYGDGALLCPLFRA